MIIPISFPVSWDSMLVYDRKFKAWILPRRAYCQWHNFRSHINGESTWIDVPRSCGDSDGSYDWKYYSESV